MAQLDKENVVTVPEIKNVTGASYPAIYTLISRQKIGRKHEHGKRLKQYDAHAYIAALRAKGYDEEANKLESYLRKRNAGGPVASPA